MKIEAVEYKRQDGVKLNKCVNELDGKWIIHGKRLCSWNVKLGKWQDTNPFINKDGMSVDIDSMIKEGFYTTKEIGLELLNTIPMLDGNSSDEIFVTEYEREDGIRLRKSHLDDWAISGPGMLVWNIGAKEWQDLEVLAKEKVRPDIFITEKDGLEILKTIPKVK